MIYLARPAGCPENTPPDYAVKVLRLPHQHDAEAVAALRRESMVGRQVSHPHVISILTARVDQAPYYVVMPRLDGLSLRSVLRQTGHIACNRVLWLVRQVAEGLDALHKRGWLHGDVKPDNVVATVQGHVTLIDLGFARPLGLPRSTSQRPLMGTLQYAAPECFVTSRTEDQRSDIYSLGVTLYELLTHRLPFDSKDPRRLVLAHLEQNPQPPPTGPPAST